MGDNGFQYLKAARHPPEAKVAIRNQAQEQRVRWSTSDQGLQGNQNILKLAALEQRFIEASVKFRWR